MKMSLNRQEDWDVREDEQYIQSKKEAHEAPSTFRDER